MTIRVKLFAIARERCGVGELELSLDGSTLGEAIAALQRRFPEVAGMFPRCAFAVNQEYAKHSDPLNDGDELAVIPPVSGG